MHKFVILLVVACGMNCGGGDSLNEDGYSTGILKAGFGSSYNVNFSKGKSFSSDLPPLPPLSTIMKPSNQGYADRKKKPKPEEGEGKEGGEEGGEDNEEGTSNEMTESAGESVAISPLPDGTSIAEAKPVGLAIAGPGGVAASKPHGTAVVGPGGLAIARPMGTAIAGVEVEGAVPIGGGNKNNKKPKQDKEQTEGELHYVGGLTGPIGNPQPIRKQFGNSATFKSLNENSGRDNLNGGQDIFSGNPFFSKGRQNNQGIQFKLGQKDGKYGFFQTFSSPQEVQKVQAPAYFYGPVNHDKNVENVYENHFNRRRA